MRIYPQHEDLGLNAEADLTEDLRPGKSEAPEVAASRASEPSLNRDQENKNMIAHDDNITEPDLPVPAGAHAGDWDSLTDAGDLSRSLEWGQFDTEKAGVAIDGFQDSTGEVSRCISVYLGRQDLDARDARALAVKLTEAADALDRLPAL